MVALGLQWPPTPTPTSIEGPSRGGRQGRRWGRRSSGLGGLVVVVAAAPRRGGHHGRREVAAARARCG
ncbi:hypothetical protein BDA96_07G110800 [Sorghum bicolor]|jgi:hypothetical protein|uniref:Uncharacterized protein n=2 Tax=Sorghum bicolor TaxID=4558 RepID=A0A921QMI5_SORBI|nr:hypothetical protein BDA96_07G110800 [Sorghum bicolor]KXG24961.1 hypothetical protein SORBI_3007G104100 [Sorghum bicolor]